MKTIRSGVFAVLFLSMTQSACTRSDTQDETTDPFPPPAIGMQMNSPEVVLDAGDERYVCRSFEIADAGLALVGVTAYMTSPLVHRLEL